MKKNWSLATQEFWARQLRSMKAFDWESRFAIDTDDGEQMESLSHLGLQMMVAGLGLMIFLAFSQPL